MIRPGYGGWRGGVCPTGSRDPDPDARGGDVWIESLLSDPADGESIIAREGDRPWVGRADGVVPGRRVGRPGRPATPVGRPAARDRAGDAGRHVHGGLRRPVPGPVVVDANFEGGTAKRPKHQ